MDTLPPLMIINAEWETEGLSKMGEDFVKSLRERGVKDLWGYSNKGHNHLSSYLSLMSGEGEEWGYEVVNWIRAHSA